MPATTESDVFAFGLLLYELVTGRRPFEESNALKLLQKVRTVEAETLAGDVEEPYRSLLRRMLVRDPRERGITMAEVHQTLAEKDPVA